MLAELADLLCDTDPGFAAVALREAAIVVQQIADRVNTPALFGLGARIAAAQGNAQRVGLLLGALEAGRRSGRSAAVADLLDLLAREA